jgi:hypothetical protein
VAEFEVESEIQHLEQGCPPAPELHSIHQTEFGITRTNICRMEHDKSPDTRRETMILDVLDVLVGTREQ